MKQLKRVLYQWCVKLPLGSFLQPTDILKEWKHVSPVVISMRLPFGQWWCHVLCFGLTYLYLTFEQKQNMRYKYVGCYRSNTQHIYISHFASEKHLLLKYNNLSKQHTFRENVFWKFLFLWAKVQQNKLIIMFIYNCEVLNVKFSELNNQGCT